MISITKEQLEQKYIVEELLVKDIAVFFNCSETTIRNYINKYNIAKRGHFENDLKGRIIGCWEVLEKDLTDKKGENNKWYCVCNQCDNKTSVYSHHLMKGTQCKKCSYKKKYTTKYQEIPNRYWKDVQNGAARRDLLFEITIEHVWDLFLEQDRKCAFTGMELEFYEKSIDCAKQTASLDRKDSSKGYIPGNVQWVHKIVNIMKGSLSDDLFQQWCDKVSNHRMEKIPC